MHQLTRLSLAHPKRAIAILLAITALLGAGLPKVRSEYGYRVLVGDDSPAIQAAVAPHDARGFRFHVAGDAAEVYIIGRDLAESSTRLVPLIVLVIGLVLYLLCRSIPQTLCVLATLGVTLLWTFGALGWLGWPRDGILEVLAPLILIVGVCNSMHLVSRVADPREQEPGTADESDSLTAKRRRLLAAERHAATGRIALGLAHDVGKDLGWMRRLVKRLPEQIGDPARLIRDVSMLEELTDELSDSIERFVRDATGPVAARAVRRLELLLGDATRRAERLHGTGRIRSEVDPALRDLHVDASLERAILNLLDNALHASPDDQPIQLQASREQSCLRIVIEDHGRGIPTQTLARAFEPGFTTRAHAGGFGVGLPVAQGIVESLGGSLELDSSARGTRAQIWMPSPEGRSWLG